jgi:hypothetical protein
MGWHSARTGTHKVGGGGWLMVEGCNHRGKSFEDVSRIVRLHLGKAWHQTSKIQIA